MPVTIIKALLGEVVHLTRGSAMNVWVAATIAVIAATAVYSYYRQFSFSIVGSVACVAIFVLVIASAGTMYFQYSETFAQLKFMPGDLVDPPMAYTVLTSMYTHADLSHLLFNVLGLVFIGTAFEQRIGTRPYMVIYFIAGSCGTLAFAALHWGDPYIAVVGASGAISGVLGAFARMFPHERMSLFVMFFPLPPMPLWVIVVGYLGLQLVFLGGATNIAVEAHLGGLVAGLVAAPFVVRLPLHRRVRRMVSKSALRRLATTPELKAILRMIEDEEIPDVRSAWVEQFLSKAKCPSCGARIRIRKDGVQCERGHLL